jgi:hypothetical protein
MPQRDEQAADTNPSVSWEQTPWLASDRTLEDPRRDSGGPMLLSDGHVIDVLLDGESILRIR